MYSPSPSYSTNGLLLICLQHTRSRNNEFTHAKILSCVCLCVSFRFDWHKNLCGIGFWNERLCQYWLMKERSVFDSIECQIDKWHVWSQSNVKCVFSFHWFASLYWKMITAWIFCQQKKREKKNSTCNAITCMIEQWCPFISTLSDRPKLKSVAQSHKRLKFCSMNLVK